MQVVRYKGQNVCPKKEEKSSGGQFSLYVETTRY